MYVLKANIDRIRRDVENIFKADRADAQRATKLADEAAVVHVKNGTGGSNLWTTRLAESLDGMGLDAIVPPVNAGKADREDYTESVIVAYNGAETTMPETVAALQEALNVTVTTATDPSQEADFVVIVGSGTPHLRP
jgi:NAD(P)H-dependent FMN reductase